MKLTTDSIVILLLFTVLSISRTVSEDDSYCKKYPEEGTCDEPTMASQKNGNVVPESCNLVLFETSDDTWGVFTLTDRLKGTPVFNYGDIVIQMPDVPATFLSDLTWNGQETGGDTEGSKNVRSLVPGLGLLTKVSQKSDSNLLPLVPRVDEGGLTRFEFAGSGAITHYHNYTWFFKKDIKAGDELIMSSSLRTGNLNMKQGVETQTSKNVDGIVPTIENLRQEGYCLDNLRPRKSRIKQAGRGAFATRDIKVGSVIVPIPLLPIARQNIKTVLKGGVRSQQLVRNYCYGHTNSSTLLFPTSPIVNLVNHLNEPNVELRWSKKSKKWLDKPLGPDTPTLVLEMVGKRDISEGEELFLYYGREWEDA